MRGLMGSSLYNTNSFDESAARDISIRIRRAQFLAEPPHVQQQTLARVRRLLEAEVRRNQTSPSYLMRHYHEIYGALPIFSIATTR